MAAPTPAHPFDRLAMKLWNTSSELARHAALHYTSTFALERIQVAINLGVATEALLMSCVASIDVTLLADAGSPQSRLAFIKSHNTRGDFDVQTIKTITWRDASKLILHKWNEDPALGALTATVERIMSTRNAAAHLTYTDTEDIAASMVQLLKLTKLIHTHLPLTVASYWGIDAKPVVDELDNRLTTAVRQSFAVKVANAKAEYRRIEQRFGELMESYIETCQERERDTETFMDGDFQNVRDIDCPACGNTARVYYIGYGDNNDITSEFDGSIGRSVLRVFVWWETLTLECPVCDLDLNGAEANLIDDVEMKGAVHIIDEDDPQYEALREQMDSEPDYGYMFMDYRDD